jgi:hypothetical protein
VLRKQILLLIAITFFIKLAVALTLPIVGDEAYYWLWGQNLQLGYFDHPGMVAWLSALSNYIPFIPKWAATRIIFVVVSCFTFFIWLKVFLLHKKTQDLTAVKKELNLFTAFYMLNPFLGLGSILITPDAPLLLFWGLASYTVLKILESQKSKDYILLGVFLGLGFCSKYHIVLFPLVTLLALAFEKHLKILFNKKTIFTIVSGLLFCAPVLIWNYQNDFASFKFQLNHGFQTPQPYQLWWTTSYLAGQILIFSPTLFLALFYKPVKSFFKISALGQWAFFLYSSFNAKVEANWPLTSHATGLVGSDVKNKKIVRLSLGYYIGLWILVAGFFFTDFGVKKIEQLPTSLTVSEISPELSKYKPLYGPTYQMSSLLSLLSDTPVYKLYGLSRYDFFDTLTKAKPTEKLFYVLKYDYTAWPGHYDQFNKTKVAEFTKYNLEVFELRHE